MKQITQYQESYELKKILSKFDYSQKYNQKYQLLHDVVADSNLPKNVAVDIISDVLDIFLKKAIEEKTGDKDHTYGFNNEHYYKTWFRNIKGFDFSDYFSGFSITKQNLYTTILSSDGITNYQKANILISGRVCGMIDDEISQQLFDQLVTTDVGIMLAKTSILLNMNLLKQDQYDKLMSSYVDGYDELLMASVYNSRTINWASKEYFEKSNQEEIIEVMHDLL